MIADKRQPIEALQQDVNQIVSRERGISLQDLRWVTARHRSLRFRDDLVARQQEWRTDFRRQVISWPMKRT